MPVELVPEAHDQPVDNDQSAEANQATQRVAYPIEIARNTIITIDGAHYVVFMLLCHECQFTTTALAPARENATHVCAMHECGQVLEVVQVYPSGFPETRTRQTVTDFLFGPTTDVDVSVEIQRAVIDWIFA